MLAEQRVDQMTFACDNLESRVLKAEEDLKESRAENKELQRRLAYLSAREQTLVQDADSARASVDQREKSVVESVASLLDDILEGNEVDVEFLKSKQGFAHFSDTLAKLQAKVSIVELESQVS